MTNEKDIRVFVEFTGKYSGNPMIMQKMIGDMVGLIDYTIRDEVNSEVTRVEIGSGKVIGFLDEKPVSGIVYQLNKSIRELTETLGLQDGVDGE
jgi:glycine cleavage system H lipoate-binding protein